LGQVNTNHSMLICVYMCVCVCRCKDMYVYRCK
jgi:hypothetical protein